MQLVDVATQSPRRLAVPLAGFPGLKLTKSTIWQNEFNPELQYRTIKALVDRFDLDAAFCMMDLAVEAGAIGLPVQFPLNESPTVVGHPVKTVEDLEPFKVLDPMYDSRLRAYVDAVRRMAEGLEVPVGAYVIGPFSFAGLMIGATEIAIATLDNPTLVHAAAAFATQVIRRYARALVNAGADMIAILEPTATFISPPAFREFSGQYVQQIIDGLDTMPILHICGNTTHLVEAMCETGVQGLSLDAPVDLPAIMPRVPEDVVVVGNIDPVRVMVNETPEGVQTAVADLLTAMEPYPNFILSTGCDLPPETPLANIAAFMEAAKVWQPEAVPAYTR